MNSGSSGVQVMHALVEAGEVGRAQECLKLFGLPESALQADVSDGALQEELRRYALLTVEMCVDLPQRSLRAVSPQSVWQYGCVHAV